MPIPGAILFPGEPDTRVTLGDALDNVSVTLTSILTPDALEIPVSDISVFPDSGFVTLTDSITPWLATPTKIEIIAYTAISEGKLIIPSTDERGMFGTTAQSWEVGQFVEMRVIARLHTALADAIIALEEYVLNLDTGGSPGGGDRFIQFNDDGVFGSVGGFEYPTSDMLLRLTVASGLSGFQIREDEAIAGAEIMGFPTLLTLSARNDYAYWGLGYTNDASDIAVANYLADFGALIFALSEGDDRLVDHAMLPDAYVIARYGEGQGVGLLWLTVGDTETSINERAARPLSFQIDDVEKLRLTANGPVEVNADPDYPVYLSENGSNLRWQHPESSLAGRLNQRSNTEIVWTANVSDNDAIDDPEMPSFKMAIFPGGDEFTFQTSAASGEWDGHTSAYIELSTGIWNFQDAVNFNYTATFWDVARIGSGLVPVDPGGASLGNDGEPFRYLHLSGSAEAPGTASFRLGGTPTEQRDILLPDASGMLALLDDVADSGFSMTATQQFEGTIHSFDLTFSTHTEATDPGTGGIKLNNATPADATAIIVAKASDLEYGALRLGDMFRIVDTGDAGNYLNYAYQGGIVDNGLWWIIPVSFSGSGGGITDMMSVQLLAYLTGPAQPSLGSVRTNSWDSSSITEIYVNTLPFVNVMDCRAGDFIALRDADNAGVVALYGVIDSPVDNEGYVTLPVTWILGDLGETTLNTFVDVVIQQAGAFRGLVFPPSGLAIERIIGTANQSDDGQHTDHLWIRTGDTYGDGVQVGELALRGGDSLMGVGGSILIRGGRGNAQGGYVTLQPGEGDEDGFIQFVSADHERAANFDLSEIDAEQTYVWPAEGGIIPVVRVKIDAGDPEDVFDGLIVINTFDDNVKIYADGALRVLASWAS